MPELDPQLEAQLRAGCETLNLNPTHKQYAALLQYLALLVKWNATYNLTAVRDVEQMVTKHLLDSLAIAPYVKASRCLDVGTGAGLPGVPLAIMCPDTEFHLLDSNGKKTRFLFQVKTALGLDNMVIHQARVESFQGAGLFDVITSRAYATLADMFASCRHLLADTGSFLAMKGARPEQELAALTSAPLKVSVQTQVHEVKVPGLNEERHLVSIQFYPRPD